MRTLTITKTLSLGQTSAKENPGVEEACSLGNEQDGYEGRYQTPKAFFRHPRETASAQADSNG